MERPPTVKKNISYPGTRWEWDERRIGERGKTPVMTHQGIPSLHFPLAWTIVFTECSYSAQGGLPGLEIPKIPRYCPAESFGYCSLIAPRLLRFLLPVRSSQAKEGRFPRIPHPQQRLRNEHRPSFLPFFNGQHHRLLLAGAENRERHLVPRRFGLHDAQE